MNKLLILLLFVGSCYNGPVDLPKTYYFNLYSENSGNIQNCNTSFTFYKDSVILNNDGIVVTYSGKWNDYQTFITNQSYYLLWPNLLTKKVDLCVYNKNTKDKLFYFVRIKPKTSSIDMK